MCASTVCNLLFVLDSAPEHTTYMGTTFLPRRAFLKTLGAGATAAALPNWLQGRNEFAGSKPNIVLIWVDDLSWADVGAYGSRFCETPNLDRFAAQGKRFTNGYAPSPICSASRAAVLTGQSPARLHFEFVSKPPWMDPF